jgi:hypothetical protein
MYTCYKLKGFLEKSLELNQNLPRDALHFGSIKESSLFFSTLEE